MKNMGAIIPMWEELKERFKKKETTKIPIPVVGRTEKRIENGSFRWNARQAGFTMLDGSPVKGLGTVKWWKDWHQKWWGQIIIGVIVAIIVGLIGIAIGIHL